MNIAELTNKKKYCHNVIGIGIGNNLSVKYCYWYWQ